MTQWKGIRDVIAFFFGLAGLAHETVVVAPFERPTLMLIFAWLAGAPFFLRWDERK